MTGLIIIGYDGSEDAGHAIDAAATILGATEAVVANVYRPANITVPALAMASAGPLPPEEEQEAELEAMARRTVEDGVERATAAGLRARPEVRPGTGADVGRTLAEMADEVGATCLVVGRRGVSRIEAAVLGSVSNDTLRESRCPVLVVPHPEDRTKQARNG